MHMPLVRFTGNIQRHVACPDARVVGRSVREALDAVFAGNPKARGYVLDNQGALRHHMVVFVNGAILVDRATLSDAVRQDDTVDVFQALSGG